MRASNTRATEATVIPAIAPVDRDEDVEVTVGELSSGLKGGAFLFVNLRMTQKY